VPEIPSILEGMRAADLIDLLLVASLFFIVLTWVRSAQSGSAARRLMALVVIYALVYLAADLFDLYLAQRVLGVLFFVLMIALVVVFQSDIRRLLDRLGSLGARRSPAAAPRNSPVHLLTEAAAHLAEERIGALIAIRGSEPWESHLQGGIDLNGKLSRPLLYSIFNPESPGHDGAVLIEGDRLTRFAVHLPLARRTPPVSRSGGTRHAAGLGLAEECDAFVIVVSEERGTISVAERGELTEVSSAAELRERLEGFWEAHYEPRRTGRRGWRTRRTIETGTISLGLAALVWFLFVYSADTAFRTYQVPVEVRNLPPDWKLNTDRVPSVRVTVSGSEPAFDRLDPSAMVVSVDLSRPQAGTNELAITDENLSLPSGLQLVTTEPSVLRVEAVPQRRLVIPVQVRMEQPLPPGDSIRVEPGSVEVLVPASGRTTPSSIPTEPVSPSILAEQGRLQVPLVLPEGAQLAPGIDSQVEVQLMRSGAARIPSQATPAPP